MTGILYLLCRLRIYINYCERVLILSWYEKFIYAIVFIKDQFIAYRFLKYVFYVC